MQAEIKIFIGLADKDSHKQVIKTADARRMCFDAFGDCTIATKKGRYTHVSGEVVVETSLEVTIYADSDELAAIKSKCRALKTALNQESIVVSWRPVGETDFI